LTGGRSLKDAFFSVWLIGTAAAILIGTVASAAIGYLLYGSGGIIVGYRAFDRHMYWIVFPYQMFAWWAIYACSKNAETKVGKYLAWSFLVLMGIAFLQNLQRLLVSSFS